MKASVETITPEIAKEYLKRNIVNRRPSQHTIAKYADDMKSGAWQVNGEPIIFNCSGRLIDGQHRLMAIVKSGITCKILVVRGVDDSVSIFNLARSRNQLDSILIDGYNIETANATTVAMARLHYYMQAHATTVSVSALKKFFDKYQDTLLLLSPIRKMGNKGGVIIKNAPILLAMMYAIEMGESPESVSEFAKVLNTGFYNSPKQSSAIVLRNDIILGKVSTSGPAQRRAIACQCIENAINDFCRERPRKKSYMKSINPVYSNNVKFQEEKMGRGTNL